MKVKIKRNGIHIHFKSQKLKVNIGNVERVPVEGQYSFYDGEYEVTPLPFEEQELQTQNKILLENVKVKEIPYYETSNIYGDTIYIGSQINN